jgi:predicted XRE-type DNA-binding protein
VFEDLGLGPEEAEHLRVRAALMIALKKVIEDRGLTQSAAAEAHVGIRVKLVLSNVRRYGVA